LEVDNSTLALWLVKGSIKMYLIRADLYELIVMFMRAANVALDIL